jgi:hypothetical protein
MFQENRMSAIVVPADWLVPDGLDRDLDEDNEAGPVAPNDTSKGLFYQAWHLTYDAGTDDLTITPQTVGVPVVVLNVPNLTQCSFAFDQSGHVNVAYTVGSQAFLYWFDTQAADWVTTPLDFGVTTPTLCLDDKRLTQTNFSDVLLFYTMETAPDVWTLFHRQQRDRYEDEYPHNEGVSPYLYKLGMHLGFRVQLGLSETIL